MATRDRGKPSSRPRDRGEPTTSAPRGRQDEKPARDRRTSATKRQGARDTAPKQPTTAAGRRARRTAPAEAERPSPAVPQTAAEEVATATAASTEPSEPQASIESPIAEEAEAAAGEGPETADAGESLDEQMTSDRQEVRRDRHRTAHANALGLLIERQFADPGSPVHSYSDLERRSGISREALSRYVTSRADRRRSPTIDTLVAIADALHVSLEGVARAAAASVKGILPPPEDVQHVREEALSSLVAGLSDAQFNAVVELLRQFGPWRAQVS